MNRFLYGGVICSLMLSACSLSTKFSSLVPKKPSEAPDYFCTWNMQGYVSNFSGTESQRNAMNEKYIFGNERYEGWASMYKKVNQDLYFLLDDSWDVPMNDDKSYFGSLIVDSTRFPSVKGKNPSESLKILSTKITSAGWKGLGLWICAQQAPKYKNNDSLSYWKDRLKWMDEADIRYWKVDWGEKDRNSAWRSSLTALGKINAPRLIIEHALIPEVLGYSEVYRTYDVENIIAVPHTIDRIGNVLSYFPKGKAKSIINCEDEPYIAVGTGCAIGVMRHEFNGNLPNGAQDMVFPPVGRDLKNRLDEVVRAVRWHRIAVPFPINQNDVFIDTMRLRDFWIMEENETWMNRKAGDINAMSAPAIITRGIEKPIVTLASGDTLQPYILASKYLNGAIAITSVGRTIRRAYVTPRADVLLKVDKLNKYLGIFGHFSALTIQVKNRPVFKRILAQDLAGDKPEDITQKISISGDKVTIPGALIDQIGLMSATKGDKSEPGLLVVFQQ